MPVVLEVKSRQKVLDQLGYVGSGLFTPLDVPYRPGVHSQKRTQVVVGQPPLDSQKARSRSESLRGTG